jgi:hypothetical protein
MRDVPYRQIAQFRLAIADEVAKRGIGAKDTAVVGSDFDLSYAALVEHCSKRRLAFAESGFDTFESCDIGACRDKPDDFAVPPLGFEAAMQVSRLSILERHFDFELDRLPAETLAEVRLDDREKFIAEHLLKRLPDHLLRR